MLCLRCSMRSSIRTPASGLFYESSRDEGKFRPARCLCSPQQAMRSSFDMPRFLETSTILAGCTRDNHTQTKSVLVQLLCITADMMSTPTFCSSDHRGSKAYLAHPHKTAVCRFQEPFSIGSRGSTMLCMTKRLGDACSR